MLLGTPDGVIVEDTEDRERAWGKMCLASRCRLSATLSRQPPFSKALQDFLPLPETLGWLRAWSETLRRSLTSLSLSVLLCQMKIISVL